MNVPLRLAQPADIPELEKLVPLSVGTLLTRYYSVEQCEAALGPVFGVDRRLISDGTYFVAERAGELIGCGGWSKRQSLFGGDEGRVDSLLDPCVMRPVCGHS